jgi:diguanylate cyclase (GGDEF)-like protein
MPRLLYSRTIRAKLNAAFLAVAAAVAGFVGVSAVVEVQELERAAQLEARHVAELIAVAAMQGDTFAPNLQAYVARLYSLRKRDVVIVDATGKALADADPSDSGKIYEGDPGHEVAATIADGRSRTFEERNDTHPRGILQVVVPLRRGNSESGEVAGAVILEYTPIRDALFAAELPFSYVSVSAGAVIVLLAALFGLRIASRITQPLADLKNGVERLAAGEFGTRVAVTSDDEIGRLARAFNRMAEDLTTGREAGLEHHRELESRVVERTDELHQSNTLLRREVDERSWEAAHDALTGLVNRREFESLVESALGSAGIAGKHHVVCFMDLDQFKVVNDTCGHAAGDELLMQIAAVLQSRVRASDTLARLGGDEFGLLLEGCSLERAQLIAADLLAAVGDFRFNRHGKVFAIGISIGLAPVVGHGCGSAEVLSMADTACYWAKDQGRNRVCVYRSGDSDMATRRKEMGWVARITQALEEERFVLYHQSYLPLSEAAGPRLHFEVLLRMVDETGELVQPGSFLPAAERYNLMPAIDRWVVKKVFAGYRGLAAQRGGQPLTCAINLSGTTLNTEDFLDFVRGLAHENALPPQAICFEITEIAAINNLRKAVEFIKECRSMGFLFALDDFGTGTSSFGYLRSLPVDYLKIDGGFVRNLERDAIAKTMAETINSVGHIMGIKTIGEYAESPAIIEELRAMGVDYAQGYGVCRPTALFTSGPRVDELPRAA